MLSKNRIKLINSLSTKKFRSLHNLFIIEGPKIINDFIHSEFEIEEIFYLEHNSLQIPEKLTSKSFQVSSDELKKISQLVTPNEALALVKIPERVLESRWIEKDLSIVLETIQDPGNLGTIIRIANWFGIKRVICSPDSVDVYNPKVIQATMGALTSVHVFYTPLERLLKEASKFESPVYGTFLDGNNIYKEDLSSSGCILFGNESSGISEELRQFVTTKLYIPSLNQSPDKTDSLNVATAAAIVCSEFKRNAFT